MQRLGSIAVVGLFLVSLASLASGEPAASRVGGHVPIITLPSLTDGTSLSVAQFRGRKLLVHQFASW